LHNTKHLQPAKQEDMTTQSGCIKISGDFKEPDVD
jgi:hypothetical protein